MNMEPSAVGVFKPSQVQFVAWSSSITEEDNDVRWLSQQLRHRPPARVLDVGGGSGQFAALLARATACQVDVLDPSPVAAEHFTAESGCALIPGDFNTWSPPIGKRYDLVIFRLVLHHLIGRNNTATLRTQAAALRRAAGMLSDKGRIYILEVIYDPRVGVDSSGRLIYEATRLQAPARAIRKLGANTAGEGVRFHSLAAWRRVFAEAGLEPETESVDTIWKPAFPWWQRHPLLCRTRYQWLTMLKPLA